MKRRQLGIEPLEDRAMLAAGIVDQDANQDGCPDLIVQVHEADTYQTGDPAERDAGAFSVGKNSAREETHGRAVTRTLKATVDVTITLDFNTGTWTGWEVGKCTHLGRFTNSSSGTLDPNTGAPAGGGGTITAANGDEVKWEFGPTGDALITGGTGRFEGATGIFVPGPSENLKMEPGSEPGILVVTYSYVGTGTITY